MYLWTFHHAATVHAYEANAAKADELGSAARSPPRRGRGRHRTCTHNVAVGARTGYVTFKPGGHLSNYAAPGEPAGGSPNTRRIWQTTLDGSPRGRRRRPTRPSSCAYVKIDIEGGTLDALKGMTERLEAHATELVSVEYARRRGTPRSRSRAGAGGQAAHAQQHAREDAALARRDGRDVYLLHAEGSGRPSRPCPCTAASGARHGDLLQPGAVLRQPGVVSSHWNDLLVDARGRPERRCVLGEVRKFACSSGHAIAGARRRPS